MTLALLTRGERGPNATHEDNLKATRTREARGVAAILGISRLVQQDFGDGEPGHKKRELTGFMAALIEEQQPDSLITYNLAGFYFNAALASRLCPYTALPGPAIPLS